MQVEDVDTQGACGQVVQVNLTTMKYANVSPKLAVAITGFVLAILPQRIAQAAEGGLSGAAAAARMEAARNEVANVRSNIFITLVELDKVRGERDPARPQFQVFTNQLARMEEVAKTLAARAQEMQQRGKAYFVDWEARTASIQDPAQQRAAKKRYGERKASYDQITKSMQEARKNFIPFLAELRAIRSLLEGNLDQISMAQARELFMRANWHCIDIQRSLMEVEQEFDRLGQSFGRSR